MRVARLHAACLLLLLLLLLLAPQLCSLSQAGSCAQHHQWVGAAGCCLLAYCHQGPHSARHQQLQQFEAQLLGADPQALQGRLVALLMCGRPGGGSCRGAQQAGWAGGSWGHLATHHQIAAAMLQRQDVCSQVSEGRGARQMSMSGGCATKECGTGGTRGLALRSHRGTHGRGCFGVAKWP